MPLKPEIRSNIFNRIKGALAHQCPPLICSKDKSDTYEIIGNTPVPYGSKKKIVPGMYFSSVVARKEMVSFYLFPMYDRKGFSGLAPTMIKCLKGKTCFNFKKEEQVVAKELDALLKKGLEIWRKDGYVK